MWLDDTGLNSSQIATTIAVAARSRGIAEIYIIGDTRQRGGVLPCRVRPYVDVGAKAGLSVGTVPGSERVYLYCSAIQADVHRIAEKFQSRRRRCSERGNETPTTRR